MRRHREFAGEGPHRNVSPAAPPTEHPTRERFSCSFDDIGMMRAFCLPKSCNGKRLRLNGASEDGVEGGVGSRGTLVLFPSTTSCCPYGCNQTSSRQIPDACSHAHPAGGEGLRSLPTLRGENALDGSGGDRVLSMPAVRPEPARCRWSQRARDRARREPGLSGRGVALRRQPALLRTIAAASAGAPARWSR